MEHFLTRIIDTSADVVKLLWTARHRHNVARLHGQATEAGKLLASRAKDAGVDAAVFDRGGYQYHGRVKALADAAREGGLQF